MQSLVVLPGQSTPPMYQASPPSSLSGPPCVAFSKMGRGAGEMDPSYQAHTAYYELVEDEDHDACLVENVPEYGQEHATKNLSKDWEARSEVVDPRLFGQGCARPRRYIVLWNNKTVQWRHDIHLEDVLNCLRAHPRLSAKDYFWMSLPTQQTLPAGQDLKHVRVFDVCLAIILVQLFIYYANVCILSVHFWSKPLFSPTAPLTHRRKTCWTTRRCILKSVSQT